MPRESVHWHVLEQATARLGEDSRLRVVLENSSTFSHLGALMPDAPYYYQLGQSAFENVAESLHGSDGSDTFALTRLLLTQAKSSGSNELLALTLGMLSHVAADAVFHPTIYYLTGNYYDPNREACLAARSRHRSFEVQLDSVCSREFRKRKTETISGYFSSVTSSPATETVFLALDESTTALFQQQSMWLAACRDLAKWQRVFLSPVAGFFMHQLIRIVPALDPIEALFSYGRGTPLPSLLDPLNYRNPVSGESFSRDVRDLLEESIALCLSYFCIAEDYISERNPTPFQNMFGPSLNFFIPKTTKDDAQYFAEIDSQRS